MWSLAAAETILSPAGWVERLAPVTRSHADMAFFRMTAWCSDPSSIPCAVDFHLVEPDEAPPPEDMAAPAELVVPPTVKTRVFPLLIHVTRTVDYRRRPALSGVADDSIDAGGSGPTPGWPTTRRYEYDAGLPDSVSSGPNADVRISPAGDGSGGSRTLRLGPRMTSPTTLVPTQKHKSKRRKRGGRKVRARLADSVVVDRGTAGTHVVQKRQERTVLNKAESLVVVGSRGSGADRSG